MKKYVALAVVTVLLLTFSFVYSSWTSEKVVEVQTITLAKEETESTVSCSGKIEETKRRDIYLDMPVMASNVKVEVGDTVKKGQVLFQVDQSTTQAMLTYGSGLAGLGASEEVLSQFGSTSTSIPDSSSVSDWVDEVPQEVTAPIDGVVTAINASSGSLTTAGQPVATISDLNQLQVKISIGENQMQEVTLGQTVSITGNAFEGKEYTGKIMKIFPSARQQIQGAGYETVVDALVSIQNPDDDLKPNYNIKAKIMTSDVSEVFTLPYECIAQDDDGKEYVYIKSAGRARRADVLTGQEFEDSVEIVSGLREGCHVIQNPDDVTDGVRVTDRGEVSSSD